MKASDTLQEKLRMSESEFSEWTRLLLAEVSYIAPKQDRYQRLSEIRGDMDTYFIAEMDRRFRDEAPLTDAQLYKLIDDLFLELGIGDMPERTRATGAYSDEDAKIP